MTHNEKLERKMREANRLALLDCPKYGYKHCHTFKARAAEHFYMNRHIYRFVLEIILGVIAVCLLAGRVDGEVNRGICDHVIEVVCASVADKFFGD